MALKVLTGTFLLFVSLGLSVTQSAASFFNWGSCLRWRITGICRIDCGPNGCRVWVRVRHWRPDEISETVNIPGDSIWAESPQALFSSSLNNLTTPLVSALSTGGGGVRTASGPIMNEKFYESHVFGVPWELMVFEQPFLSRWGCRGGSAGLHYASEPDPLWHNDFRDQGFKAQASMIGIWGPLYPRQGRAFHGSDVVASALLSYRALNLTAGTEDKQIQLGSPTHTGCMTPGLDPQTWDYNRGKPGSGGKYLWVYWKPVTCCIRIN